MLKVLAVVMGLAGCSDTGRLEERVAALDQRLDVLMRERAKINTAPLALSDVPHWWCWVGRCERTEELCKLSIDTAVRLFRERGEQPTATKVAAKTCERSALAYCSFAECFGTNEMCIRGSDDPRHCREIE